MQQAMREMVLEGYVPQFRFQATNYSSSHLTCLSVFSFSFSLTTNSPRRSLSAPLRCNMNLHIHSKSSSLPIPCGRKSPIYYGLRACMIWLQDASKFIFCCCSQISQWWKDFPHCPFQISNSSTPSRPPLSILILYILCITIWHILYSQFLLFIAVMLYKVTVNAPLAHREPLFPREMQS